ncbi:DNA-directed RNA polymerase subunit alpha C-terminal domain-containing protein [uncultured Psychrobacter sp.]|uniref:DNA-directed RNA polymerase subunit alpha C-terminal domain-containing protein n=1 Tax=uncultured Psychrobacter sp. TaxID=259303 RepID=UPI0030DB368A
MEKQNLSKLERFSIGILAHRVVDVSLALSMAKELVDKAKVENLSNGNEISKKEAFAFELLKNKDINVGRAWIMAGTLISELQTDYGPQVKNIDLESDATVEASTDTKIADIATLLPFDRRLEVGQVWLNLTRNWTVEVEEENLCGGYFRDSVAQNKDDLIDFRFMTSAWVWELMLEDESREDCKKRAIRERSAMAKSKELQKSIIDEPSLSVQTENLLRSIGIESFADLLEKSYDDLKEVPGMGKRRLQELMDSAAKYRWCLGMLKINM